MKEKVILFDAKSECCGCASCANACPRNAIRMKADEDGFVYPEIDDSLCVSCGTCKTVCNFRNGTLQNTILDAFAGKVTDNELLSASSSGGVFAALAESVINAGGVVYGCAYSTEEDTIKASHIRISSLPELKRLQGTKYVQSRIGDAYRNVRKDLESGVTVLFCGTPCQVDGLNGYLKQKTYENLFTIDIVCHGVPGEGIFAKYIQFEQQRSNGKVTGISFRDKRYGWGSRGTIEFAAGQKRKEKMITPHNSSYYRLFLDSEIYRENCYSCKYANNHRTGDVTLGDYWGIEKAHPEQLKENGGPWDSTRGISCILVSTPQGKKLMEQYGKSLDLIPSTFEKIAGKNPMLLRPCKGGKNRTEVLSMLKTKGYAAVDKWCMRKQGPKRYLFILKNMLRKKN